MNIGTTSFAQPEDANDSRALFNRQTTIRDLIVARFPQLDNSDAAGDKNKEGAPGKLIQMLDSVLEKEGRL